MNKPVAAVAVLGLAISVSACVFISRRVEIQKLDPQQNVTVSSPVKAHLNDGTTVTYPDGVIISGGVLRGAGLLHDLALTQFKPVREIPLESVAAMESFRTRTNVAQSIIVSSAASVGGTLAAAGLAVAIFGSCPTVYSGDGEIDEGELFSSSIVPLFEARDMDRLHARASEKGFLDLELRNEALETHYINHLQIAEAAHSPAEYVLPDADGRIVAVRGLKAPGSISDRRGEDIRAYIGAEDEKSYATHPETVDRANAADLNDWIDFTVPVAAGENAVSLVFRMRNSLLSTTLLYDVMLKPAGARALDWLNRDLMKISNAVELGRWHHERAGLHVHVWRGGEFIEVARVPDSGPISWHDVAVSIPAAPGEPSLRVRLSFLADHWRIDRIAIAQSARVVTPRTIPLAEVAANGIAESAALQAMSNADQQYLQTGPGQRFFLKFDVGPGRPGEERTFLLSSQGYYTEWIRGSWIRGASADSPFTPTDDSLIAALRQWSGKRDAFEKQFRETRIPVK